MNLQDEINQIQKRLAALKQAQGYCQHTFGEAKYTPIYKEAYTIPGDPPGTMGVDWRGPIYVPAKTTPRWTRVCTKCGLEQHTEQTKNVVVEQRPIF